MLFPNFGGIEGGAGAVPPGVDKAPDFELPDQDGVAWRLADHLEAGPVLLVFYRGDW